MTLTVADLRKALEDVPDDAEVVIGIKELDPSGEFRCYPALNTGEDMIGHDFKDPSFCSDRNLYDYINKGIRELLEEKIELLRKDLEIRGVIFNKGLANG